jgi:Protein of unknown function (DUF2911)
MKSFFTLLACCCGFLFTQAQDSSKTAVPVDKSPMDMSYFPDQYPLLKFQGKAAIAPYVRVIYGRPQKDGRAIFGELIRYNEIWRIGANEATEIEFYKDATVGGKKVPKGRYTLYCIPTEANWTFIINRDTDSWGAFKYDAKKDVVRLTVKTEKNTAVTETLSIMFQKNVAGAALTVSWDMVYAKLPIVF